MRYSVKANSLTTLNNDCLVVAVWGKGTLSDEARDLDRGTSKAISNLIKSGDFTGKIGQTQLLHNPAGIKAKRLLLVGAGTKSKFVAANAVKFIKAAARAVCKTQAASAHFALGSIEVKDRDAYWAATQIAQACEEASYHYTTTKSSKGKALALKTVSISPFAGARRKAQSDALKTGQAIGHGLNVARELGNLPGNICTPTYLAEQAKALANRTKSVTTQILSEKQMARLGMGSLLSVAAGSAEEAKLIVMQYKGGPAKSQPYALVGKGITFDTGGISLKPGLAMDEMKFDMCGAASVFGVMNAIVEMKLPINVVAVVAAAENMPGSKATKPGDIVTSMSGKTIEILNTDAEGRLVLCDALTYVERFNPRTVIDIATLTGAAVATFGSVVSALLSNDDALAKTLLDCGQQSGDPAWQLPLWDDYQRQLNSNFADIANIGGPKGGTITAACFLSRFTEKMKWAHLDIAGSAWNQGAEKGATGRPVPLLLEYLRRQKA